MRSRLLGAVFLAGALSVFACSSGANNSDAGLDELGYVLVDSISPDHGPLAGGNIVTVKGAGFTLLGAAPNKFSIGDRVADFVSVIDDQTLEVLVPAGTSPGKVGIAVFNQNGSASLGDVYTYNELPTLISVSPERGVSKGGETITLAGTGFTNFEAGDNRVFFGNAEAEVISVDGDTGLTVKAPPGPAPLFVDVRLENNNGAAQLDDSYRYTSLGLMVFGHGPDCKSCGFGAAGASGPIAAEAGDAFLYDAETKTLEEIEGFIDTPEVDAIVRSAASDTDNVYIQTRDAGFFRRSISLGETTSVGSITGCANEKIDSMVVHQGSLFATCRDNPLGQGFGVIDPIAATFTPVGAFGQSCCRNNLASDGTNVFFIRDNQISKINTVDASLSETTSIVGVSGGNIRGAAFAGNTLYIIAFQIFPNGTSRLFTLDPATGQATFQALLGSFFHGLTPVP